MTKVIEERVRNRAQNRCEYCQLPESALDLRHVLDHIIAQKHHGPSTLENLALSCGRCNLHKGPNIAGIDPESKAIERLFNPRTDVWSAHFIWQGATLVGMSAIGRCTVDVLNMNGETRLKLRRQMILVGKFPPGIS